MHQEKLKPWWETTGNTVTAHLCRSGYCAAHPCISSSQSLPSASQCHQTRKVQGTEKKR